MEEADIEQFGVHQYFKEDCFFFIKWSITTLLLVLCLCCVKCVKIISCLKARKKHYNMTARKCQGNNDTKTAIRVIVWGAVVKWYRAVGCHYCDGTMAQILVPAGQWFDLLIQLLCQNLGFLIHPILFDCVL